MNSDDLLRDRRLVVFTQHWCPSISFLSDLDPNSIRPYSTETIEFHQADLLVWADAYKKMRPFPQRDVQLHSLWLIIIRHPIEDQSKSSLFHCIDHSLRFVRHVKLISSYLLLKSWETFQVDPSRDLDPQWSIQKWCQIRYEHCITDKIRISHWCARLTWRKWILILSARSY